MITEHNVGPLIGKTHQVEIIETTLIKPNSFNPNKVPEDKLATLEESIKRDGQQHPIILRNKVEHETLYEIIDGENRYNVLKKLGSKHVKAIIYEDVSDEEAMRLCYQVNVGRGEMDLFKEAEFFNTLTTTIGNDKIANQYGYSETFVRDRKRLLDINKEEKEMLMKKIGKETNLTANHWIEYAKLNHDERIEMVKSIRSDSIYSARDFRDKAKDAKRAVEEHKKFLKVFDGATFKTCPTCKGKATSLSYDGITLRCDEYHSWDPIKGIEKQKVIGNEYKEKKAKPKFPRTIWTTLDLDNTTTVAQGLLLNVLKKIKTITFDDIHGNEWSVNFPINSRRLRITNDKGYFTIFENEGKKVKIEVPGELTQKNYDATKDIVKWLGGEIVEKKKKEVATK